VLVSDAFDQYRLELKLQGSKPKTSINYRTAMKSLIRLCGDAEVTFINMNYITAWKIGLDREGKSPTTIRGYLSNLREVMKYVQQLGFRLSMDLRDITFPKIPKTSPVWLDIEELSRFMSVIERPRDKALFACLFSSGARISELLSLNVGDIVNGEAQILGKGDKPGIIRFDSNALSYLDAYLQTRSDNLRPLFISGQRRRITVSRVEQTCHEYADRAGIDKNVTPHVMRHSFASDLKRNGADIYDIMQQLRHSQISSTMIYTHVDDRRKTAIHKEFHSKIPMV
jgi:site-specific recombinase XerD